LASPQLENGYLSFALDIADALAGIRISGEEYQCLWVIWRKTYGWRKTEDMIALTTFQAFTGIKKSNVVRALKRLESKRVITVKRVPKTSMIIKNDNEYGLTYSFQKNYEEWRPLSKKIIVIKNDNASLSSLSTSKDNSSKDKSIYAQSETKKHMESFNAFWKIYPRKVAKEPARKAWLKITPEAELVCRILSAVEAQSKTADWLKEGGNFIPYPASWLNAKRWEDELIPATDPLRF
jgi:phage replication O-like protein O